MFTAVLTLACHRSMVVNQTKDSETQSALIYFSSTGGTSGSTSCSLGVISQPAGYLPQHAAGALSVFCSQGRHRRFQFRRGAKQSANFELRNLFIDVINPSKPNLL
jgi:hypothetical protein